MDHLLMARSQMAFSLAFHIIFAAISMVMPFLMYAAYRRYLKHRDPIDLQLTKAWMKGSAIIFATGAVSGTALSFQLGLLWPGFMEHAGPIFGMPFSLEGAAFFLEAIFMGLFMYGWGRIPERRHLFFGLMMGVCGLMSGLLVIAANGWMNAPTGFDWVNGQAENIHPWKAMFNRAWPLQALHMLGAAFQAVSIAALGVHCLGLLRGTGRAFHLRACSYLMPCLVVSSFYMPFTGDLSAKSVAKRQPEKLAAMEAHFETATRVPLIIGGIPNEETQEVKYAIKIPGGLSFLAFGNFNAEVKGLNAFPEGDRPPVLVPHIAFQLMVGIGMLLLTVSLVWLYSKWKKRNLFECKWWQRLLLCLAPLGFVALESGWIVTEVGRQPWVIYRIMRTADSVTAVPGLGWNFIVIFGLYGVLGFLSFGLLWKWFQIESAREEEV
ncbi:cytochrome ubiquinol oxidase subunit I [Kiritimatiellota bacterium B12222]|nr:cytochrome ubiquinol oxidase subunit I [Kiritimatiellota bacterium B12222]